MDLSKQITVRLLDVNDLPAVAEILHGHGRIGKMELPDSKEKIVDDFMSTISNPKVRVIGYFEDDLLISFLVQLASGSIASWHMTLLGTRSPHKWNYQLNGLERCWSDAFAWAEERKMYRVYWSLPERWAKSQDRTVITSPMWQRYDIYIEDVIEPGQTPKYTEHQPSFGAKLKTYPAVIKSANLKNDFRSVAVR